MIFAFGTYLLENEEHTYQALHHRVHHTRKEQNRVTEGELLQLILVIVFLINVLNTLHLLHFYYYLFYKYLL